jgi:peptide subunit release factor 1 (eRF1)
MLSWEQLEQLERFDGAGTRVLSLYMNLDPQRQPTRSYRIEFKDRVRELSGTLARPEQDDLAREADRVALWLDRYVKPEGQGLILFSCTPRDLWWTHFVSVPLRDHLAFDVRPDIGGLLELVDDYERFAVALVSKDRGRLFTVFAGGIEEIEMVQDYVPGRIDTGALKQSKIQRHHDMHVLWHLKNVVSHLSTLQSRRNFDRLIIMGPVEATTELQHILPHALRNRIAAVVRAESNATTAEVLDKALEVGRQIEAEGEERLVRDVLEMAGSGGRAACGVNPTLEALWIGDVRMLLVAEGTQITGTECSNCRRLHRGTASACGTCGAPTRVVADFVHQIAARAVDQGGRVEFVHGAAAERLNSAGEGLAAFLRYPWTTGILEDAGASRSGPELPRHV